MKFKSLYREDLSEVNEKLVSKYRQLLANRAPQQPQRIHRMPVWATGEKRVSDIVSMA
jgi:hypothetical protein